MGTYTMKDVIQATLDYLESKSDPQFIPGIPTGLKSLDEALGGFHDGSLIVLGSRPGMGATQLLLNFMLNAGVSCGYISNVHKTEIIGALALTITSQLPYSEVSQLALTEEGWDKFKGAIEALAKKEITLSDRRTRTIGNIQSKAEQWKEQYSIKALYIDSLQKITGNNQDDSRSEQVYEIVSGLRTLAKNLDIPVIVAASVGRSAETYADKRPEVTDLLNGSVISSMSDVILMLYRNDYYYDEGKNDAELLVRQSRGEPLLTLNVGYDPKTYRYFDLTE